MTLLVSFFSLYRMAFESRNQLQNVKSFPQRTTRNYRIWSINNYKQTWYLVSRSNLSLISWSIFSLFSWKNKTKLLSQASLKTLSFNALTQFTSLLLTPSSPLDFLMEIKFLPSFSIIFNLYHCFIQMHFTYLPRVFFQECITFCWNHKNYIW